MLAAGLMLAVRSNLLAAAVRCYRHLVLSVAS
jgi:hypothetical protein